MAQSNGKKVMFLAFVVSLLLVISMADNSRKLDAPKHVATAHCKTVTDAEKGDTCSGIAELFNLDTKFFSEINPNLDCDNIFVGQWLCIDGFVSP